MPDDLEAAHAEAMAELTELGELWLERRACRLDNKQIDVAIGQATRDTRRLEKKMRFRDKPFRKP